MSSGCHNRFHFNACWVLFMPSMSRRYRYMKAGARVVRDAMDADGNVLQMLDDGAKRSKSSSVGFWKSTGIWIYLIQVAAHSLLRVGKPFFVGMDCQLHDVADLERTQCSRRIALPCRTGSQEPSGRHPR
jgi:hypothetical protein